MDGETFHEWLLKSNDSSNELFRIGTTPAQPGPEVVPEKEVGSLAGKVSSTAKSTRFEDARLAEALTPRA